MDLMEQIRVFTYVGFLLLLLITIGIISIKAKKRAEFPLDETIEVIIYNLLAFLILLGINYISSDVENHDAQGTGTALFLFFGSWIYIIPFTSQIVGVYTAIIIPTDQKIEGDTSETEESKSSSAPSKSYSSSAFEYGLIAF